MLVGHDIIIDLAKFWHQYMDVATRDPDVIEWSILNECFENLPSDELRITFVSPSRLAIFAARLEQ